MAKEITIALAGNPNCGKTTLFNALTGSSQYVGNWPGVTVEKKEGRLKTDKDIHIMDLPGIYSLSPYTPEEIVSRNYLIDEAPDVILNVVDASNLERNLYLTTQLMELGIPVVAALNMMDVAEKNGDQINEKALSEKLGIPVVSCSAIRNANLEDVLEIAKNAAGSKAPVPRRFSDTTERTLALLAGFVPDSKAKRYHTVKLFERDEKDIEKMGLSAEIVAEAERIISACEERMDDDSESIITNDRYDFITASIGKFLKKTGKGETTSDKIDKIVTNRFLALPIFALIMTAVYFISVTTVGTWATDWANDGLFGDGFHLLGIGSAAYEYEVSGFAETHIFTDELQRIVQAAADAEAVGAGDVLAAVEEADFGAFEEAYGRYGASLAQAGFDISSLVDPTIENPNWPSPENYGVWVPGVPVVVEGVLDAVHCADWLKSLILDGIIGGVGGVLGFVPQLLVLFLMLAFLESCGYMARVAFVMDRIFRKFGLSGKSFIPMLVGVGCGVPGIMASRTIENVRDRRMTIMTTTFIPCGAKMPIVAMIAGVLFGNAWWVAPSAFFLGCTAIVISGIMLKKTKLFAGDPAPFVMELPAYHMPTLSGVLRSTWERGWSFIKKAGTVILLSTIIIWAGSVFGTLPDGGFGFSLDMEMSDSVLGMIGKAICWLFIPLGFGDPAAAVATLMGLLAKEEVVAVFGVLDFMGMTPLAGYSFLAFNLLCAPCFAAMGAIKREMNSAKWTAFAIAYQCVFAYAVSLIIYQFGLLLTGAVNVAGLLFAVLTLALIIFLLVRPAKKQ